MQMCAGINFIASDVIAGFGLPIFFNKVLVSCAGNNPFAVIFLMRVKFEVGCKHILMRPVNVKNS